MLQADQANPQIDISEVEEKRRAFYTVYENHIKSKEYQDELSNLIERFSEQLKVALSKQTGESTRLSELQSFSSEQFIIVYLKIISGNALTVFSKEEITTYVKWIRETANYLVQLIQFLEPNFDFNSNLSTIEGEAVAQLAIISCLNHYQKWQEANPSIIPNPQNQKVISDFLFKRPYDEPKSLYEEPLNNFLELVIKHGQTEHANTTISKIFEETHNNIRKLITFIIDYHRDVFNCQSLEKLLDSYNNNLPPETELETESEEIYIHEELTLAEKIIKTKAELISQMRTTLSRYEYIISGYQTVFDQLSTIFETMVKNHPESIGVLTGEQKEILQQQLKIELLRGISGEHSSKLPEPEGYILEIVENNTPLKTLLYNLRNTQVDVKDLITGEVDERANNRDMRTFSNLFLQDFLNKLDLRNLGSNDLLKYETLIKEFTMSLKEKNRNLFTDLERLFINPTDNNGSFSAFKNTQKIIIKNLWTDEYIQTVIDKHTVLKNSVKINSEYILNIVKNWNL